jgi:hypothetical protein
MKHPQQRRDGQTLSEEGRLAVLANSPKGQQLAAHPPQAQCRTKRHIPPLLKHNTNYNIQKREMAGIHLEANHSNAACTWHATCDNPGQLEHQHNQKRDQKTNQLQTKKNQTGNQ